MASRISLFLMIILQVFNGPAVAGSVWYRCVVRSSSHTGYYTFKIDQQTCSVYWLEIDTQLKIKFCRLPEIEALKPSARDDLSVVWFNMKNGRFYDYLSGVYDRGQCKVVASPQARS
jgi:hypothetical protein